MAATILLAFQIFAVFALAIGFFVVHLGPQSLRDRAANLYYAYINHGRSIRRDTSIER